MKRKFSLVVVISLIVSGVMAQNAEQTLRGAVGDAFTGSPIIGATVMVPASNPFIGTSTDFKGIAVDNRYY